MRILVQPVLFFVCLHGLVFLSFLGTKHFMNITSISNYDKSVGIILSERIFFIYYFPRGSFIHLFLLCACSGGKRGGGGFASERSH